MRGLWLLPTPALLILVRPRSYFGGFSLPSLALFTLSFYTSLSHSKRTNRRSRQRPAPQHKWLLQPSWGQTKGERGRGSPQPRTAPGPKHSHQLLPLLQGFIPGQRGRFPRSALIRVRFQITLYSFEHYYIPRKRA